MQDQSPLELSELWACCYPYLHVFIFSIIIKSSWQLLSSHMGKDPIYNSAQIQTQRYLFEKHTASGEASNREHA